jgi:hypothetical protein
MATDGSRWYCRRRDGRWARTGSPPGPCKSHLTASSCDVNCLTSVGTKTRAGQFHQRPALMHVSGSLVPLPGLDYPVRFFRVITPPRRQSAPGARPIKSKGPRSVFQSEALQYRLNSILRSNLTPASPCLRRPAAPRFAFPRNSCRTSPTPAR